jgi:uncharacterized membrane protein
MNGKMQWLWIVILAMIPISELRGAIPLALGIYKLNLYTAIPVIIAANFLPVPFILKFLRPAEIFLRRWKFWNNLMDRIFERTRKKTKKSIEKWESLALIIFVAIPLPVTGAWTGSLAAYLFGLDFKKSLIYIFIGIVIAGIIVTTAVVVGINWFL